MNIQHLLLLVFYECKLVCRVEVVKVKDFLQVLDALDHVHVIHGFMGVLIDKENFLILLTVLLLDLGLLTNEANSFDSIYLENIVWEENLNDVS